MVWEVVWIDWLLSNDYLDVEISGFCVGGCCDLIVGFDGEYFDWIVVVWVDCSIEIVRWFIIGLFFVMELLEFVDSWFVENVDVFVVFCCFIVE